MTEEQINKVCEEYSANDMRMLRQLIYPIVRDCGKANTKGEDKDYIEFLSDANYELVKILRTYDETKNSNVYAYIAKRLPVKMSTVLTRLNRDVRMAYERDPVTGEKVLRDDEGNITKDKKKGKATRLDNASLDYKNEDGHALEDTIADKNTTESVLFGEHDIAEGSNAWKYLRAVAIDQRDVALMLYNKCTPAQIKEQLHITDREYSNIMLGLRATRNKKILMGI